MKRYLLPLIWILGLSARAQDRLQPGFNGKEYAGLLSLAFYGSGIPDSAQRAQTADPYRLLYQSPERGLLNRWSLYLRNDGVGVIELRGTVNQVPSWLENFYAAMVPATGSLELDDHTVFRYQLASDPRAMVHAGWTTGLAFLAPDIEAHVDSLCRQGHVREFLIFGHSQGGALAFLVRSYLAYEIRNGHLPDSLRFKTYCSAAPKPGNLYYAYDYDFLTRGGWGLTVVNAADWVPESPFSLQTLRDFNTPNPFLHVKSILKKQRLLARAYLSMAYRRLDRRSRKAERTFRKYLGYGVYRQVRRTLPGIKQPDFAEGGNFMRAGIPIVLQPDETYRRLFPDSPERVFIHHQFEAYYQLVKTYYPW
ncbi:MAG TPA: hypothetical protein VG870_08230 [Chitinophagaceae bacterium]|nr:hypothetical protein [Chitinophagaceae bacterium]